MAAAKVELKSPFVPLFKGGLIQPSLEKRGREDLGGSGGEIMQRTYERHMMQHWKN